MAALTYRCFDLVTFVELDSMPFQGVSFGDKINDTGSFSGSLNLFDPSVQALDWQTSTQENRTCIVVDLLGVVVWSGIIFSTNDVDGKLTVKAGTIDQWTSQRIQAIDYSVPPAAGPYWKANPADPTVIAAQVLYDVQQRSIAFPLLVNGNVLGVTGVAAPGPGVISSIPVSGVGMDIPAGTPFLIVNDNNNAVYVSLTDTPIGATIMQIVPINVAFALPWGAELISYGSAFCSIGGNGLNGTQSGIQILINGNPPPVISGGTAVAQLTSASNKILVFGINSGLVNGSAIGDGAVNIPAGATVSSWSQSDRQPGSLYEGSPTSGSNKILLYGTFGVTPRTGQLITFGASSGCPIGTTITDAKATAKDFWEVTMSHNATASHSNITIQTSPFYTVFMTHNATATIQETVDYSITAGHAVTPSSDWISQTLPKTQYQTVQSILQSLAAMGHNVGFDYSFDVSYIPGTYTPEITFNISYPRKGASGSAVTLNIRRGQIIKREYDKDGTQQQIGIIETASGVGGISSGAQWNQSLVTIDGYPVVEGIQSHAEINDASMLKAIAQGDLQMFQNPASTLVVTVVLTLKALTSGEAFALSNDYTDLATVGLGEFVVGDDVVVTIDPVKTDTTGAPIWGPDNDPRFPNGMNYEWRINSWLATVADKGTSTIALTLGLPPTDPTLGPPTPPPR